MITRFISCLVLFIQIKSLKLFHKISNLNRLQCATNDPNQDDNKLIEKIMKTSSRSDKLRVNDIFTTLISDPLFYNQIWQKRPFLCKQVLPNLDQGFH